MKVWGYADFPGANVGHDGAVWQPVGLPGSFFGMQGGAVLFR